MLTKDEILNMPAGREMDALIAEKVMKLKMEGSHHYWMNGAGAVASIPRYSTDIAAAWDVVEKINSTQMDEDGYQIVAKFHHYIRDVCSGIEFLSAAGAAYVICRTALLTVNDK
jgi:hypothetical protein